MRGANRLRNWGRRLAGCLWPGSLILMYHRVVDLPPEPHGLCVSPKHFAEQLEVLASMGMVVPLARLAQAVADGRSPRRMIAITLDDGYSDTLRQAKPLLERYGYPATAFVTSGQVGSQRQFWWDELEELLLEGTGSPPPPATLVLHLRPYPHATDGQEDGGPADADSGESLHWDREQGTGPDLNLALYHKIHELLLPLAADQQRAALDQLWAWAGRHSQRYDSHRAMSLGELRQLAADGLVEIGAHTVTHANLASLPAETQARELTQSKAQLESMLARPVRSVSYPHSQYTAQTMAAARQAGFACACAYGSRAVRRGSPLWALPRCQVRDWDRAVFAEHVARWLIH